MSIVTWRWIRQIPPKHSGTTQNTRIDRLIFVSNRILFTLSVCALLYLSVTVKEAIWSRLRETETPCTLVEILTASITMAMTLMTEAESTSENMLPWETEMSLGKTFSNDQVARSGHWQWGGYAVIQREAAGMGGIAQVEQVQHYWL
jgi:hypothetical protein